ncbi:hypothetical protein A4X13_0g9267 [Tilletia indica]|uniref:Nuclear speckle splicing regulatory protein 1 N-terminal domain-containing protein n=1 Tax=Tilletia indica TaxID=43049 RepID=A0A177TMA2_9BASI|nr:hypothetical protein A4X13_0g9267 [Tilletia indica]
MAGFSFALKQNSKAGSSTGAGASSSSLSSAPKAALGRSALRDFGGDEDEEDEEGGAFGQKNASSARPSAPGSSRQVKEKPLSVFGEESEDDDEDEDKLAALPSKPSSSTQPETAKKSSGPISRASRLAADQALAHDASIFEYDSVYDAMKTASASAKQKQKEADQAAGTLDEEGRPAPKYIDAFLQASAQRKRDHERAEAKKIQRERDAEGDEFADKEAFVTDAYREQMEAIKIEEEEEAKRQAKTKPKGVQAFYSNLLTEQSAAHEAAVKAANTAVASRAKSDQPPSSDPQEESEDLMLARKIAAARDSGLAVDINDDNQVVDNRSLLGKGLNLLNKKKKPETASRLLPPGKPSAASTSTTSRNLSTASSFNSAASRARQTSHLEAQLVEVQRKREAEEELEREKTKVKLMGVKGGTGEQERTEREAARQKARERAMARRNNKSEAPT